MRISPTALAHRPSTKLSSVTSYCCLFAAHSHNLYSYLALRTFSLRFMRWTCDIFPPIDFCSRLCKYSPKYSSALSSSSFLLSRYFRGEGQPLVKGIKAWLLLCRFRVPILHHLELLCEFLVSLLFGALIVNHM